MIQPETIQGRKDYFRKRRHEHVSTWITDADGVVHIPLQNGMYALIDACDKQIAATFKWHAHKDGCRDKFYVEAPVLEEYRAEFGHDMISLHRLIMRPRPGQNVDHIDGNPLNCRRSNLRVATQSQNASNRYYSLKKSPYRGVVRSGKKWAAQITVHGHNHYLGLFINAADAARAYNLAARRYFGDFAILNQHV